MSGTARTTLRFEALERKQPLAGDVVVSLVGGNLVIEGDEAANQILISSGEEPGSFVIQGLEGTVVKLADAEPGDPPAPETGLVVEGVRGHVRVGLGEGDDLVAVHDAQFRRGLTINTGTGADEVRIGAAEDADPVDPAEEVESDANVHVRGSLLINTGEDGDTVNVASASVGGLLTIATDGGDDTVSLGAEAASEAAAAVGAGEDATLHAKLGVSVLLGEGVDAVIANDVATRGVLAVGGGDGADSVEISDSTASVLGIRGGDGDAIDRVALSGLKARHAAIGLGDGADEVSIVDSAFGSLAVALGAGDDSLSIQTVKATRALLAGGEGDGDELTDAGDNTFRHVAISGFELPPEVNTDPIIPRIERPGLLGGPLSRLLGRLRR
jgi:hypothetical protein